MHNFNISICFKSSFFFFFKKIYKTDISHFESFPRCVFPPLGLPLGSPRCVFLVVPPRFGVEVLGQGFPPFTCIHYHSL